jgi:hypothetical protein
LEETPLLLSTPPPESPLEPCSLQCPLEFEPLLDPFPLVVSAHEFRYFFFMSRQMHAQRACLVPYFFCFSVPYFFGAFFSLVDLSCASLGTLAHARTHTHIPEDRTPLEPLEPLPLDVASELPTEPLQHKCVQCQKRHKTRQERPTRDTIPAVS